VFVGGCCGVDEKERFVELYGMGLAVRFVGGI
jgi:hypothetical protein